MRTRLAVAFAGRPGLVVDARHDPVAVSRVGRQDAVGANQVEPWRRYESCEFLEQFVGRQNQVGSAVGNRITMHLLSRKRRIERG